MAVKTQGSRPPPVRTNTSHKVTSPLASPRLPAEEKTTTNKRATVARRRSAHVHGHERRASRPATLSRRTTPQYITKVNSKTKIADKAAEEDRDESFLNFCTFCEKQVEGNSLYCSDSCKKQDLHSTLPSHPSSHPSSPPLSPFATYFPPNLDGPDIIPRASPTQSRPRSYFNSEPLPEPSYQTFTTATMAPPPKPSALASLQELAAALPPPGNGKRPSLPTSHTLPSPPRESPLSKSASVAGGVWNYLSHAGSKPSSYMPSTIVHKGFGDSRGYRTSTPTPSTTPTQHSWMGMGYAGAIGSGLPTTGSSDNLYGLYGYGGPLPRRAHGRGGSVDLVTPFAGAN